MTPSQFDALAKLTRAREPARTAARRVLIDGIRPADAAREYGMSPSALGNTLRRYRLYDALIRSAYVDQQAQQATPAGKAKKGTP